MESELSEGLRWGRIIGGAFLLELVLAVVLIPPLVMLGPELVIPTVPPAVLALSLGFAWLFLRKVPQRPVVHGLLIGILATAIYILLNFFNPNGLRSVVEGYGTVRFVLANGFRVLGCAAGGYVVSRRQR
jgi:hypothetical protein